MTAVGQQLSDFNLPHSGGVISEYEAARHREELPADQLTRGSPLTEGFVSASLQAVKPQKLTNYVRPAGRLKTSNKRRSPNYESA